MKKVLVLFAFLCVFAPNAFGGTKTVYRNSLVFAYSQANSVYEDENIKLEIYDEQLWATNKTSKTIFIDLSQCFAFHNGSAKPLFNSGVEIGGNNNGLKINEDKKRDKKGDKKASKAGISTKDDAYITLAPNMGTKQNETKIYYLTTWIYGHYSTSETPSGDFTEYDKRLLNTLAKLVEEAKTSPKDKDYEGTVAIHLTEDESINNIGASIAYAFNKNTENWTTVSLSTWVSDVIFAPYYVEMPKELKKKDKKGFGVKETDPAIIHVRADSPFEFDEDKSPIIVCEWQGSFKKGTFTLTPTWVTKKAMSADKILEKVYTSILALDPEIELYKSIIRFDGEYAFWGEMTRAKRPTEKTGQTK